MGNQSVSFSFLLPFVLLVVMHGLGNVAAKVDSVIQLPGDDQHSRGHGHGGEHPSSHMDKAKKPGAKIFFRINDIKIGKRMVVYFPHVDVSEPMNLLPKQQAHPIPFASKALPQLFQRYNILPGSPDAKVIEESLWHCESPPVEGEVQHCATSWESLFDFATNVLGSESIQVLTTYTKTSTILQNYTVLQPPKEMVVPMKTKMMPCHKLVFPYPVYFCHHSETENKVFEVSLRGDNGDMVNAITVCHMDTSHWDPHHVSFTVLGVKPGTPGICHFFPADNMVLLPA